MRIALLLGFLVIFPACTVRVVDARITREEVVTALKQRDQALGQLAQATKELQDIHQKELKKNEKVTK